MKATGGSNQYSVTSDQYSVISNQYSVISNQGTVVSSQWSVASSGPDATTNPHVSRFTFQSSRITHAFTLIELLVVIAIISLLAAMIIPITGAVKRNQIRAKARAELTQIESAIENYKTKLGHYPPDNPGLPSTNQLLYELLGTTNNNGTFWTIDGSASIPQADFALTYGPNVTGFANTSRGSGDEGRQATSFLTGLKPGQVAQPFPSLPSKFLTCSIPWDKPNEPFKMMVPGVNPICYNSSSPTNNANSFDLWIDVYIAGKTNRICNWSKEPLYPYLGTTPWME